MIFIIGKPISKNTDRQEIENAMYTVNCLTFVHYFHWQGRLKKKKMSHIIDSNGKNIYGTSVYNILEWLHSINK